MALVRRIPPIVLVTLIVLGGGGGTSAQQPAGVPAPPITAAQQPARPAAAPVVRFAPGGISLEDAVRLTLQHDPNLQRQQAQVKFGDGVVQEQAGPFDLTLFSNLQYEYRVQELTEARKQTERDKRDKLQQFIDQNTDPTNRARTLIPILENLRSPNAATSAAALQQLLGLDPSLAGLITTFDALIAANANNAAVVNNLRQARSDFINNTLREFQNSLSDQVRGFEGAQTTLANLGAAPDDEVFYNGRFEIGLSKMFRNGVQFGPHLDGGFEGTNFKGKPRQEEFGGKGLEDLFTFHAGANFFFPLARGRGSRVVAAGERAAVHERDAAQLTYDHQASVSALATVLAYWDVRAAQENVAVLNSSLGIQTRLLSSTENLINSGDLPRVELSRARAADARVRAQLADAQRQLHENRIALATAMGVSVSGDEATIPVTSDAFPAVPDAPPPVVSAALIPDAVSRRKDLDAAGKRVEAGQVLQDAAVANLRVRLDLSGDTWYTALEERTVANAIDRWVGPSYNLNLQLERPFGNNFYRGQLAQRDADSRIRQIQAVDLRRQIGLDVAQLASTVPDALARVRQAQASVGFYNEIVTAELSRFSSRDATLIDTLLMEQQQTESQFAQIAARRELARLIAQLRFQTGTLLPSGMTVSGATLTTLPQPGSPR
jgi:outer membrane protein TolC